MVNQKRASLPTGASPSGSSGQPQQQQQTLVRSPSPETIARMSQTGPAMSPSSRTESFENRRVAQDALAESESKNPLHVRPRSPRPQSDGRLDRSFKFPVAGSNKNGQTDVSESDVPLKSPPMSTPVVHIQAPSTDGPISAPVGYTPAEETEPVKEEAEEDVVNETVTAPEIPEDDPPSYTQEQVEEETTNEEPVNGSTPDEPTNSTVAEAQQPADEAPSAVEEVNDTDTKTKAADVEVDTGSQEPEDDDNGQNMTEVDLN